MARIHDIDAGFRKVENAVLVWDEEDRPARSEQTE
jgi:hypothetical protein